MIVLASIVLIGLTTTVTAIDSIFDIIQNKGLDMYESFLEIANLDTFLDCNNSLCSIYTAFAPTNEAFDILHNTFVTRMTTNKEYWEHLRQWICNHLIYGCVYSTSIKNGNCYGTCQGEKINITKSGKAIIINNRATVV